MNIILFYPKNYTTSSFYIQWLIRNSEEGNSPLIIGFFCIPTYMIGRGGCLYVIWLVTGVFTIFERGGAGADKPEH